MDKDKPVHMELNRTISSSFCKIEPQFASYVENSSKLIVKLKKVLYGCIQSGLLWYRVLDDLLQFRLVTLKRAMEVRRDRTSLEATGGRLNMSKSPTPVSTRRGMSPSSSMIR
jgi:hypothetical protein